MKSRILSHIAVLGMGWASLSAASAVENAAVDLRPVPSLERAIALGPVSQDGIIAQLMNPVTPLIWNGKAAQVIPVRGANDMSGGFRSSVSNINGGRVVGGAPNRGVQSGHESTQIPQRETRHDQQSGQLWHLPPQSRDREPRHDSEPRVRQPEIRHENETQSRGRQPQTGNRENPVRSDPRTNDRSRVHKDFPGGGTEDVFNHVNPRTGKTSTTQIFKDEHGVVRGKTLSSGAKEKFDANGNLVGRTSPKGYRKTEFSPPVDKGNGRYEIQKTVIINNRRETVIRNYDSRGYRYRDHYGRVRYYPVYIPVYDPFLFDPWYYERWGAPIPYGWGWEVYPWYGYYGWYFRPYPYYVSLEFMVTDLYFRSLLEEHYEEAYDDAVMQAEEREQSREHAAITQEMKDEVAAQVREAMENYKEKRPVTLDGALEKPGRIFAAHEEMGVTDMDTDEGCTLAKGNLVRFIRTEEPEDGDAVAVMKVLTSKEDSCAAGSAVRMGIDQLQDMQNDFAQRVEKGMGEARKAKEEGKLP